MMKISIAKAQRLDLFIDPLPLFLKYVFIVCIHLYMCMHSFIHVWCINIYIYVHSIH